MTFQKLPQVGRTSDPIGKSARHIVSRTTIRNFKKKCRKKTLKNPEDQTFFFLKIRENVLEIGNWIVRDIFA